MDYYDKEGRLLRGTVSFDYNQGIFPLNYFCNGCGEEGVKLWLDKKTGEKFCLTCTLKGKKEPLMIKDKIDMKNCLLEGLLPAIPATEGICHSNGPLPRGAFDWWLKLPAKKADSSTEAA